MCQEKYLIVIDVDIKASSTAIADGVDKGLISFAPLSPWWIVVTLAVFVSLAMKIKQDCLWRRVA